MSNELLFHNSRACSLLKAKVIGLEDDDAMKGKIWVRTATWEEISAAPDVLHLPGEDDEATWLGQQSTSVKCWCWRQGRL